MTASTPAAVRRCPPFSSYTSDRTAYLWSNCGSALCGKFPANPMPQRRFRQSVVAMPHDRVAGLGVVLAALVATQVRHQAHGRPQAVRSRTPVAAITVS